MKITVLTFLLVILTSCASIMKNGKNDKKAVVFRFLYQNNYGFPLDESTFWSYGVDEEEFARYDRSIELDDMMYLLKEFDEVSDFRLTNASFIYQYAIVFSKRDTIYFNDQLDKMIIKKKGSKERCFIYNKMSETKLFENFIASNKIFWTLNLEN